MDQATAIRVLLDELARLQKLVNSAPLQPNMKVSGRPRESDGSTTLFAVVPVATHPVAFVAFENRDHS